MNRVASTSNPLLGFERLRHWWHGLATAVFPALGGTEADRTASRLIDELKPLLEESRGQRGGEVSARSRAERVKAMQAASDDVELSRAEARLRVALDAPRAKFLAEFNLLPEGVKFLVDLRADLLALLPQEPALEVLQVELDE